MAQIWSGSALPAPNSGIFPKFRTRKNSRDRSCIDHPATHHRREQRTEDRQRGIPKCGETGQGERLLLGTAEGGPIPEYRCCRPRIQSCDHRAVPYRHQPRKALNILLKEIGVQKDHIVIDPYTGALGYGFEYPILRWNGSVSLHSREMRISRCR